jgi:hypothetical protein
VVLTSWQREEDETVELLKEIMGNKEEHDVCNTDFSDKATTRRAL